LRVEVICQFQFTLRTRNRAVATGFVMPKLLSLLGQALLRPIIKLKAICRRNAILFAHMTPEQLRERARMLDELRLARDSRRDFLVRFRPPCGLF
jgi:hypothetical protein